MRPKPSQSVAIQGELGAFSHSAALKILGDSIQVLPCPTFREAFDKIRSGEAVSGVIPMENTLHGSVHENYDHLLEYDFFISGETSIRISHQLIVRPGVKFRDIRRIFSHPVALNQCKRFFEKYSHIEPVPQYDTAGSVKLLNEQKLSDTGAIASETAAEIYGGVILKRNIEDNRQNFTRFFLLTKQPETSRVATGEWKTSIVFSTANTPGALFRAMACFALRDLSLTKIESRPLRGKPWEYLFYLDLQGRKEDEKVQKALAHLGETAEFLKVLGSYRPTL
ncbi:MAG: prephenate dehydratase [Acidobacteriaceae bacterium]|nr:prephenate dehydratase [Acidobacteriaceae bacterium]